MGIGKVLERATLKKIQYNPLSCAWYVLSNVAFPKRQLLKFELYFPISADIFVQIKLCEW